MELRDRARLAARMKECGASQRDVAKAAGWKSHAYLSRLLAGSEQTLNLEPALKIAFYLDVPVSELFEHKEKAHEGDGDVGSDVEKG